MPRAFRSSIRWSVGAFTMLLAVGITAPSATAQDGGGETPPQVDPNSPLERIKDVTESAVGFIEGAAEAAETRLFGMIGQHPRTVRQEAERSIKGVGELAKRTNRQLDALSRQFLNEFKRSKASKAKVDELKAAVKTARATVKAAQDTAISAIRAQRDRTLTGDVSNPNPPQSGPG